MDCEFRMMVGGFFSGVGVCCSEFVIVLFREDVWGI